MPPKTGGIAAMYSVRTTANQRGHGVADKAVVEAWTRSSAAKAARACCGVGRMTSPLLSMPETLTLCFHYGKSRLSDSEILLPAASPTQHACRHPAVTWCVSRGTTPPVGAMPPWPSRASPKVTAADQSPRFATARTPKHCGWRRQAIADAARTRSY